VFVERLPFLQVSSSLFSRSSYNSHAFKVLISAHYDSVSTAPGATDDGIGAVTLLQLIEAFARSPAQRDVIFNINNGEEDGLHGALA
jgi:Zn-dependent M28 family amino/carboxypeptidase